MPTHPVIKAFHKLEDGLPGLPSRLKGSAFYTFLLERAEKGLGDGIVVTVAGALMLIVIFASASLDSPRLLYCDPNERAAQLMVAFPAEPSATLPPPVLHPGGGHGPADHPAGERIQHHCQREPALRGPHRSHI